MSYIVLLALALAGESPSCILHEGIHTPRNTRDRSITRSNPFLVDLTAEVFFLNFFNITPSADVLFDGLLGQSYQRLQALEVYLRL